MDRSILSNLTVLQCVGYGGFGIVFRVKETDSTVNFALKLQLDESCDETEQKRLMRECAIMSPLDHHPNLVKTIASYKVNCTAEKMEKLVPPKLKLTEGQQRILDTFKMRAKGLDAITLFVVKMELCGNNLKEWLNIHRGTPHPQSLHMTQIRILRDAVEGLKYLHYNKIIHRDIKPENIMFSISNQDDVFGFPVKLGDFGLCRIMHSPESMTKALTRQVGTMRYMAPEVLWSDYGFQSDIYSLGLVAWEVATLIDSTRTSAFFYRLVNDEDYRILQEIDHIPSLRNVIIHATKRQPQERMASIEEFVLDCSLDMEKLIAQETGMYGGPADLPHINICGVPDIYDFGDTLLKPLLTRHYARLTAYLDLDGYTSPKTIYVEFKQSEPLYEVASHVDRIWIDTKYVKESRTPVAKTNIIDKVLTYAAYCVMNYNVEPRPPNWFICGLGQYLRVYVLHRDKPFSKPTANGNKWMGDAGATAYFLYYIKRNYSTFASKDLIQLTHQDAQNGRFNNASRIVSLTGKTLDELWQDCITGTTIIN